MRQVTFGGANSLDNFIARHDGGVDWLMWSDEAAQIMAEFWPAIDTIVMGRKTYEVSRRMSAGGQSPEGDYSNVKTYVFSRTLPEGNHDGATIVRDDAADFVRRLKTRDGKGICVMGGGELARSLFEADLIDRVGLNIHPLLLGAGVPLFHAMTRQIDLELEECRPFRNGCISVTYRVKHGQRATGNG
jgi:dihydrofolate reductase